MTDLPLGFTEWLLTQTDRRDEIGKISRIYAFQETVPNGKRIVGKSLHRLISEKELVNGMVAALEEYQP